MGLRKSEQYDMFDVASGACEFGDYLLGRFNEMDLQTQVSLDPFAKVEEQSAPAPVLPQGPPPPAPEPPPGEPPPDPEEMARLIANFHAAAAVANFQAAAAAYQERAEDE